MYIIEEIWKEYLSGSKELFDTVAQSFLQDYENYVSEIDVNIKCENVDILHNMLHSLKGITLNLGMKELYNQTENTLIPIRKNIIDINEFNKLKDIFQATYDELKNMM